LEFCQKNQPHHLNDSGEFNPIQVDSGGFIKNKNKKGKCMKTAAKVKNLFREGRGQSLRKSLIFMLISDNSSSL